jgi:hypothetical protein
MMFVSSALTNKLTEQATIGAHPADFSWLDKAS